MPLTLDQLKKLHDKAYNANQVTREQASDDLIFYWVTQWDDQLLGDSSLQYRGEFNVLRKAGRQIMANLAANPVQPDFHPIDEARDDDAEIMDGLYRAVDRSLAAQEAYDFAKNDAVVCGYGAWMLYTDYKTNRIGDEKQVIKRKYIPEANNTVFFDPNDNTLAKSNSKYVSVLNKYTKDGYEDLVKDLTGDDDYSATPSSFKFPEQSYTFPWAGGEGEKYYVTNFYHREKVKDSVLTFVDPMGETVVYRESDIEEVMEELLDDGYSIQSTKDIERWEVRLYIASGEAILNGDVNEETGEREGEVVAGEFIPVVPCYGEYVPQLEGESYWSGVTRLAKDPQRLRNFQMSYLADIVSRSPRPKPIFYPEQVQGFEMMFQESGADNNYPYLLQNRKTATGEDLPLGAVAQMPEQQVPQALAASIQLSREAINDVADPGLPQDIADPDLSGKAVLALQNRIDQQDMVYQENWKHAKKRDAEIFASMASEIMDTPQTITIQTPDGNTRKVQIMRVIIDEQTGEPKTLNDLTNLEFEVYADIGASYESQKQQTLDRLETTAAAVAQSDPALHKILVLKMLEIMPGVAFDDVRDYVRKQLIEMGIKEPETEEEIAMMQARMQQGNQPDPAMVLAMAEQEKAQADKAEVQRKANKDMMDAQAKSAELLLKEKDLNIKEAQAQVNAAKVGVDIRKTLAETNNIEIDSQSKRLQGAMQLRGALVG